MAKLSFVDKIAILFEASSKTYLSIITIIILIGFSTYILLSTKKEYKQNRNIIILSYISITLLLFIIYFDSLSKMFDYMMNNIIKFLYFPDLAIYFIALIIVNIILVISILNKKISKNIKKINIIVFSIITYIQVLLLDTISRHNLDVFKQNSVYGNKTAQGLIELSSIIFIIWILFLSTYKIVSIILNKNDNIKEKEVITKKVVVKEKVLPDNINKITCPKYVKAEVKKEIKEDINIPHIISNDQKLVEQLENNLTLNDYKNILKLLKYKIKKIDIKENNKSIEQHRLIEELYKSIR